MNEHDPNRDPLADAIEQLQTFARQVPPEAPSTRRRVMANIEAPNRSRIKSVLIAFGLLAFGGPALAHFSGTLAPIMAAVSSMFDRSDEDRPRARIELGPDAAPRAPEVAPQREAPAPTPEAAPETPLPATTIAKPQRTSQLRKRPDAGAAETSPARALYLGAHKAHFGGGSPEAALQAWDAFLAAAPDDTFAPEARFNRAILLIKLRRPTQAAAALEPFVCAANGAYRQREASALLARLRAQHPELPAMTCAEAP